MGQFDNEEAAIRHDIARRSAPAEHSLELSESSPDFPAGATLWVGTAGDVVAKPSKGADFVTYKNVQGHLPVSVKEIDFGSGTTATDIVALW